jgi:hypothetical protein
MQPWTRRPLAAAVALAALLAFAADVPARKRRHDGPPPPATMVSEPVVLMTQAHLLRQLDDMSERIAAVRAVVDVSMGGEARDRAMAELAVLRRHTQDVREAIRTAPPMPATTVLHVPAEPPPLAAPVAMAEREFAGILAAMGAEIAGSSKLRVLGDAASHHWFSVDQVKRVIGEFSFSSEQLDALRLLAPQLADPQNAFRIYESFTFDSDKDQARKILSGVR